MTQEYMLEFIPPYTHTAPWGHIWICGPQTAVCEWFNWPEALVLETSECASCCQLWIQKFLEIWGRTWGELGIGYCSAGMQCCRVYLPKLPLSPGELTFAVWISVLNVGDSICHLEVSNPIPSELAQHEAWIPLQWVRTFHWFPK